MSRFLWIKTQLWAPKAPIYLGNFLHIIVPLWESRSSNHEWTILHTTYLILTISFKCDHSGSSKNNLLTDRLSNFCSLRYYVTFSHDWALTDRTNVTLDTDWHRQVARPPLRVSSLPRHTRPARCPAGRMTCDSGTCVPPPGTAASCTPSSTRYWCPPARPRHSHLQGKYQIWKWDVICMMRYKITGYRRYEMCRNWPSLTQTGISPLHWPSRHLRVALPTSECPVRHLTLPVHSRPSPAPVTSPSVTTGATHSPTSRYYIPLRHLTNSIFLNFTSHWRCELWQ